MGKQLFQTKTIKILTVLLYLLTAAFVFSKVLTAKELEIDPLWEKASAVVQKNRNLKPHRIVVNEVTKNNSGKIEEHIKLELRKVGQVKDTWKPVLLNDETIPPENEKYLMGELEDLLKNIEMMHPFEKHANEIVRTQKKVFKKYNGINVTVYSLTTKKDEMQMIGEILINQSTGAPLEMSLSSSDSYEEEGVTISDYKLTVNYTGSVTDWHPVSLTESMILTAKTFPFLTWVGTHVSTVTFHDYKTGK